MAEQPSVVISQHQKRMTVLLHREHYLHDREAAGSTINEVTHKDHTPAGRVSVSRTFRHIAKSRKQATQLINTAMHITDDIKRRLILRWKDAQRAQARHLTHDNTFSVFPVAAHTRVARRP